MPINLWLFLVDCAAYSISGIPTITIVADSVGRANVDVTLHLKGYSTSQVKTNDCQIKSGNTWACGNRYVGSYIITFFANGWTAEDGTVTDGEPSVAPKHMLC